MNEKLVTQQVSVKQKSETCDALLVDISAKTEQLRIIHYYCIWSFGSPQQTIFLFFY